MSLVLGLGIPFTLYGLLKSNGYLGFLAPSGDRGISHLYLYRIGL